jgi:soluble lytic murein transglycosylase-like protein
MEKGMEAAKLAAPAQGVYEGVDLSVLPKYICFKAALLREKLTLQYAILILTVILGGHFVLTRFEVASLYTKLREKEYILAPGVQDFIPAAPQRVPERHVIAAAMDYPRALRMINRAWDEKSELRANTLIQAAFPKEFFETVKVQSKQNKLDPVLVLSLIRQESSFNVKAVSTSGALGLMQMIPPTAKEVAQALKIKDLELPYSMYVPETNIKMGTYYIAKMIRDFQSNIPLGLAAYNAGPTKVKRWMNSSGMKPQLTSSPEYDVWIDMLPWAETRFYVKAILRNYLIYQLVDLKPVQVKDPVWPAGLSQPEG